VAQEERFQARLTTRVLAITLSLRRSVAPGDSMKKRLVSVLVAGLLAFTTVGASPASAIRPVGTARSFANCDKLHKKWKYGVAKSRKAARKQVRTGHYKPHVSRAGYRANSSLDADKDGTACEVLK
jgi:excalibur calcium-binding domain-containing protein